MENKEKTTTATATENKETTTTKKEGEKKMNKKTTATEKKVTKTTEKKTEGKTMENKKNSIESLRENIEQASENMETARVALVNSLNHVSKSKAGNAKKTVDAKYAELNKTVSEVNGLKSLEYYRTLSAVEIIKAGSKVPVVTTATTEEAGVYKVETLVDYTKPTLSGMVRAGVVSSDISDNVDLLRRCVAYLKTGNALFLTGDIVNKKDVPNKAVSGMIENMGGAEKISKTKVKVIMRSVLKDLTDGAFDKDVLPALYSDLSDYILKRSKDWGKRSVVSKGVASDLILEYVYMSLNGLTGFQMVIE